MTHVSQKNNNVISKLQDICQDVLLQNRGYAHFAVVKPNESIDEALNRLSFGPYEGAASELRNNQNQESQNEDLSTSMDIDD